jgi:hypothetical protein
MKNPSSARVRYEPDLQVARDNGDIAQTLGRKAQGERLKTERKRMTL